MTRIVHGVVHGQTIALEEDLGFAEGQVEELTIRAVEPPTGRQPGEGFLRTEGALADDPYWDAIMAEVYQERKRDTRCEAKHRAEGAVEPQDGPWRPPTMLADSP